MTDRRILLAAVLTTGAFMGACSRENGVHVQTDPSSAPTVTASSAATSFPGEAQILAQYRGFFAVLAPVSRAKLASVRLSMLKGFATEPSLTRTLGGFAASYAAGEVLYGRDLLRPKITMFDGTTATLRDCQDSSGAGRVNAKTGRKVTVGRKDDLALVTMKLGLDAVWRVSTVTYQPAGSCSGAA
jgi:hypothetical protein